MPGAPALPFVVFALGAFQVPPGSDTQPVAPVAPAPEAGVAPAEVETTPAVQRPSAAPEAQPSPAPAAAPEPIPEPAVNPDATAAPVYPEPAPAAPAPDPGVGTTQQVDPGSASAPPPSQPSYVSTDPKPGEGGQSKREQRRDKRQRKPFLYNPLWLSAGLGVGFWGGGQGALNVGVDATYFFIPWVGAGLDLSDTWFFGAEDDEISNIFRVTPTVTLIAAPRSRFTPYVRGGLGPVFYNRGGGTLGRWVGGGGFIMRFTRAFVNIGVDVSAQFPDSRYEELVGGNCPISDSPCSLNILPRIGFGFALGQRRH